MNYHELREVINGPETFKGIADYLKENRLCYIGWTDEEYTHLDILFSWNNVVSFGNHQRGIYGWEDLFVSIMSHNAYGFRTDSEKSVGYIIEKLRMGDNQTSEKLTELINGVCKELNSK